MVVDLEGLSLHTDDQGLPIHGTMSAQPGWEVVEPTEHSFTARFDFGEHPDLLASFPFPHELRVDVAVAATTLRVATTLTPDDRSSGPRLVRLPPLPPPAGGQQGGCPPPPPRPSAPRARPAWTSDGRGPHRGRRGRARSGRAPSTTSIELDDDRRLELTGGGRRLALELEEGYSLRAGVHAGSCRQRLPRTDDGPSERPRRRQVRARRVPEPPSPPASPSTSRTPRTDRDLDEDTRSTKIREPGVGIEPTTSALQEQCSTN